MTTKRPFEDGVHYVAPAPTTDRHPLRWMVKSFRHAKAKSNRRAETKDAAVDLAKRLTSVAIEKSPEDLALFNAHREIMAATSVAIAKRPEPETEPLKSVEKVTVKARKKELTAEKRAARAAVKVKKRQAHLALRERQREDREARAKLERFATTHFNCIRANPVAQVWQCVSMTGERKPVGRRKSNGRAPDQAPVRHAKMECAVLMGKEPLRDEDGRIVIFRNWQDAETKALELYYAADEEERIFWQEPEGRVVGRTIEVEIMFDPAVNGAMRPFNLWFYKHAKPYYRSARAKHLITPAKDASGRSYQPQDQDDRAAHDFNRAIERMAFEDSKMLSMEVAKFRTIWEAEAEAIRLEKEYFGNHKYYP